MYENINFCVVKTIEYGECPHFHSNSWSMPYDKLKQSGSFAEFDKPQNCDLIYNCTFSCDERELTLATRGLMLLGEDALALTQDNTIVLIFDLAGQAHLLTTNASVDDDIDDAACSAAIVLLSGGIH